MDFGVFWSVLFVMFVMVPLILIWAFAIFDLFGRRDLGGLAKIVWLFAIVFFPIIGTVVYFLFRPRTKVDDAPELASAHAGYVADKLTELTALADKGVISPEEFEKQRVRLLAV